MEDDNLASMNEIAENTLLKLKALVKEKGVLITPEDLLVPEVEWIISNTTLTEEDRQFAELRYIKGKSSYKVMEELGWYSTNTFTRHNKKVWARLIQTLIRLVD